MGRRGGGHDGPDGLVVVDKPTGWTSHDVVAKSRGLLGTRKVGHAGTLDPDATGVLLLGVGKATKLLRFLSPLGKSYVGEVRSRRRHVDARRLRRRSPPSTTWAP
jgi:tRNA pseudouridine55 synthase